MSLLRSSPGGNAAPPGRMTCFYVKGMGAALPLIKTPARLGED
jgi:hypothetical protein